MNINSQLEEGQKEAGVSSSRSYFKFTKGDNRIRILTEGKIIATHFFGKGVPASTCYGEEKGCPFHGKNAPLKDGKEAKPSIKYTCYVLNIKDRTNLDNNEVELADLPYSVIKQVGDYQENVDYSFTSFPMPYDVTVSFDPEASSPVNMYKVIASPKREEVSDVVKGKLAELMQTLTPEQSVQKKKEYQIRKHTEEGKIVKLKSKEELNKEFRDKVASGELEDVGQMPEYPTESISPDDISF